MNGAPLFPCLLNAAAALALAGCFFPAVCRADWAHYRGPGALGASFEKGLNFRFPRRRAPCALDRARRHGDFGDHHRGRARLHDGKHPEYRHRVLLDVRTGREVWRHQYPLDLDKRMFEGGTAATPTVDEGRVFTVSHQGDVFALEAASGKKIWYKHLQQDFGGKRPEWGFSGSPTVEGNLLLLDVGGRGASTVALDKATGSVVWKSGDDGAGYASPVVANLGGKRTVVVFKAEALVGLDVKDGRELWRTPWKTSYDVNAATPLVVGDRIFVSSGYGTGSALFEISGGRIMEKWRNKNLRAQIASPAYSRGLVYGIDDKASASSPLVCVDFATGALKWTERRLGGSVIVADGKLLILSENGELIIAEESGAGFRPLARAQVLPKRCWVQPTVADGRVFVRNNDGQVAALDFGAK